MFMLKDVLELAEAREITERGFWKEGKEERVRNKPRKARKVDQKAWWKRASNREGTKLACIKAWAQMGTAEGETGFPGPQCECEREGKRDDSETGTWECRHLGCLRKGGLRVDHMMNSLNNALLVESPNRSGKWSTVVLLFTLTF